MEEGDLSSAERDLRWSLVEERWGPIPGAWYPMISLDLPPFVIALQKSWFHSAVPLHILYTLLHDHGIRLIWGFREDGSCSEMDIALFEPEYDGREGYWTSQGCDWLMYASHEGSLTIAGEWLIDAVKAAWPEWEHYLYTNYDYPPPPLERR